MEGAPSVLIPTDWKNKIKRTTIHCTEIESIKKCEISYLTPLLNSPRSTPNHMSRIETGRVLPVGVTQDVWKIDLK